MGYGELRMRDYLKSKSMYSNQAKIIFKIRTRMINVKNNFRNGSTDVNCSMCKEKIESQIHIFTECNKVNEKLTMKEYLTLFSEDEEEITKIIVKIEKILTFFENFKNRSMKFVNNYQCEQCENNLS